MSPYLEQLNARELASMLYRDNLRLKHAARQRLQDELDSAKLAEDMRRVQADRESGLLEHTTAATDPLARALLSHLQEASQLSPGQDVGLMYRMTHCRCTSQTALS